jgi:hypothetical protein
MAGRSRNPEERSQERNAKSNRDRGVLADPDIRGSRKGRLGVHDDERYTSDNDPGRVERAWAIRGRG